MKKFWFYIEPYVLFFKKGEKALFYNTLDYTILKIKITPELLEIMEKLEENKCILLEESVLLQPAISTFLEQLRTHYLGDKIIATAASVRPALFQPIINNQREFRRVTKNESVKTDTWVMDYLEELYIGLNGVVEEKFPECYKQTLYFIKSDYCLQTSALLSFLENVPDLQINQINLFGGDVLSHPDFNTILRFLRSKTHRIHLFYRYDYWKPEYNIPFKEENYSLTIIVPLWEYEEELFNKKKLSFEKSNIAPKWVFLVHTEAEYTKAIRLVSDFSHTAVKVIPVYTGDNLEFFKAYVFTEETDLTKFQLNKREIYTRQKFNPRDFGRLSILPDGKIYANVNFDNLGEIYTDHIQTILYKELQEGQSWLRIRDKAPCRDCVYQWLCPPPSNYEIALGKYNLCHLSETE